MNVVPRVSVIMPAYSAAEYVSEAIESILGQTFRYFELIVVDDGSVDGTAEIVAEYAGLDPRIILIGTPHCGVARASNTALSLARGEYVARHDADDVSLPERFAAQVAFLDAHPDIGLVGTAIERFGTASDAPHFEIEHEAIRQHLMSGAYAMQNGTAMARRDVWQKVGGYRPQFLVLEDVDFFLRVSEITRIANLPDVHYRYRKVEESETTRSRDLMSCYLRLAVECALQREEFGRDLFLNHHHAMPSDITAAAEVLTVGAN